MSSFYYCRGIPGSHESTNKVGMERAGYTVSEISEVRKAVPIYEGNET